MNKHLFIIRKMVIGLTLSASFFIATSAFSKTVKQVSTVSASIDPSVKFIGNDNSGSFFQVKFVGEIPVKFDLLITDAFGNTLYNQGFEASSFSRYIKMVNEGNDNDGQLTFYIRTADGTRHSFRIDTSETQVKEVVVTKL